MFRRGVRGMAARCVCSGGVYGEWRLGVYVKEGWGEVRQVECSTSLIQGESQANLYGLSRKTK